MYLSKGNTTDYESKTSNILNAAGSVKNFEFDFGLGNVGPSKGQPLGSLKEQKVQQPGGAGSPSPQTGGYPASQTSWNLGGSPSTPPPAMGQSGAGRAPGQQSTWTYTPMSSTTQPGKPQATTGQPAWTHVPAKGMSSFSPASPSSSPWSATPAASAGLTGSSLKDDSLADLWKTSATSAKGGAALSSQGQSRSSSLGSNRTTNPSIPDSFGSGWTAASPLNNSVSSGPNLNPTSGSAADPFAILTGPAPVSLSSLKKAKDSAAEVKAKATAAAAMASPSGGVFGMGSLEETLGQAPPQAGGAASGGYQTMGASPPPAFPTPSPGPVTSTDESGTVRFRTQTATVEVGEITEEDAFQSGGVAPTANLSDPFGDMFGAPAGPPPSSSYGNGSADGFDDFQSSAPPPSSAHPDQGFSTFESAPSMASSNPDPFPAAQSPLDPFAASADPFAFGSSPHAAPSPVPAPTPAPDADPFASVFGAPDQANAAAPPSFTDPFAGASFATAGSPQPAAHPFASVFGSAQAPPMASPSSADPFAALYGSSSPSQPQPFMGGGPASSPAAAPPVDPLEALLMKRRPQPAAAAPPAAMGQSGGGDDWAVSWGDFQESGQPTRELADVGSAPPGVTSTSALKKGTEFYKGGQFADAIKWLMWAEQLCEAEGQASMLMEVLSKRATCYKEAGEMKKAVADCSKIIEVLPDNTVILMQRALLYESMEKYKAGVEDLRKVVQLDPSNRQAAQILNRLNKVAAMG